MEERPKIKLVPTPFDKVIEKVGNIMLVLMWFITLYTFFKLPDIIPIHFNGAGKANRYGDKLTLLFLPILATVLYVGISYLNKFPHIFNYGVRITAANANKQYSLATRMLRYIKLAIVILFTVIITVVYFTTVGKIDGLGWWFLPLTFILFLVPTFWMIIASYSKKNQ